MDENRKYLSRKIDSVLDEWKSRANRKPILLKGARQVGKTEAIRAFAARHYDCLVEINFVLEPQYKQIVEDGYDAQSIRKRISALNPLMRFIEGRTLIFFDEIQDFPDIATSFKSFKLEGKFDVVSSGSMLGVQYRNVASVPVGYKEDLDMDSFDFEEFLWAVGYDRGFVDDIYERLRSLKPFDEGLLSLMNRLFMDYCTLGGMPEIVLGYVERGTFEGVLAAQRQLMVDYRADVRKYAVGVDQSRILNVLDHIAPQLAKENKKFQITHVAKDARFKDYRGCVDWLKDAGVVRVCPAMDFPELPIRGNVAGSRYKLYMADSGLLLGQLDDESQNDFRTNRNLHTYKGGLYENIVAEALAKSGAELVYYKREDSTLEMDFFLRTAESLVPVEVKAGSARAKSLTTMIESDHYPDVKWGIKLKKGNVGFENKVLTLPHWAGFLLKRMLGEKLLMTVVSVVLAVASAWAVPAADLTAEAAEKAARFQRMSETELREAERKAIAGMSDLALIPPRIETRPDLRRHGFAKQRFAMNCGLVQTKGGRLFAFWIVGGDSAAGYLVGIWSDDNGKTWGDVRLVVDPHFPGNRLFCCQVERNVVIAEPWVDPDGALRLYVSQLIGHFDGRESLWEFVCRDPDAKELVWEAPRYLYHGSVHNKPIVLKDGSWLLPADFEAVGRELFPELDPVRGCAAMVSEDRGKTWVRRGFVRPEKTDHYCEHSIVERDDGSLLMYLRTGFGLMSSVSADGARTWSVPVKPKTIDQPIARAACIRLKSGRFLFVKNGFTPMEIVKPQPGEKNAWWAARSRLTAFLSEDGGETWKGGLRLDPRTYVAYPDAEQLSDGSIVVTYDHERARPGNELLFARFTEEDVLAGKLVSSGSSLTNVIFSAVKSR